MGKNHNEKTEWQGLWKQREGVYSGKVIRKNDIPAFGKLIVRHNKFYEADSNKPRFVYCFASGNAADSITLEFSKDEYVSMEDAKELSKRYCFTYSQLQELINKVAVAAGGESEYGEHIPSDFIWDEATGVETEIKH